MIRLTKQMKKDIQKIKEEDMIVCQDCGKGNIQEKMWVDSNSYMSIEGESYYKYNEMNDGEEYWCESCHNTCIPLHIPEYKKENK